MLGASRPPGRVRSWPSRARGPARLSQLVGRRASALEQRRSHTGRQRAAALRTAATGPRRCALRAGCRGTRSDRHVLGPEAADQRRSSCASPGPRSPRRGARSRWRSRRHRRPVPGVGRASSWSSTRRPRHARARGASEVARTLVEAGIAPWSSPTRPGVDPAASPVERPIRGRPGATVVRCVRRSGSPLDAGRCGTAEPAGREAQASTTTGMIIGRRRCLLVTQRPTTRRMVCWSW